MAKEKDNLFSGLPDNLPQDKKEESALPEELQGKSPEEMYQMLASENERLLKEKEDEYKQSQQNQQVTSNQQTQQGRGYVPPNVGSTQTQGNWNYGNQGTPAGGQQEEVDYWSDPEKFMDQQLQRRMQPIVQTTVQSVRGANKSNFVRDVGDEEWNKYGGEVEQLIDSFSPQVQMHPDAYKQAYNIVMANHLDEVTNSKAEKIASEKLQRTLMNLGISEDQLKEALGDESPSQGEGQQSQSRASLFQRNIGVKPSVESGSRGNAAPKNNGSRPKLTEREKMIAQEFGMEPSEYKEWAQLNTDVVSQLGGE